MEEPMAGNGTHWCHLCRQVVSPLPEVDTDIKCPICQSGFLEEMGDDSGNDQDLESEFGSDRALSLWAPILLGMMGNPRRRRSARRLVYDDEPDNHDGGDETGHGGDSDLDRELESMLRSRRRSSGTILRLLQNIRAGLSENGDENSESDWSRDGGEGGAERERHQDRDRERVILINPFNRTIIVHGPSYDSNQSQVPIGSLGDYFIGPGLELLLQHLAENDPNRYGTPPAQKDVVEAMPTVKIQESLQCSVCLDDIGVGAEAREMPCKHKFHNDCILPWLELHSSCPVCRYQLPAEESKRESDGLRNNNNQSGHMDGSGGSTGEGLGNGEESGNADEGHVDLAHGEGNHSAEEGGHDSQAHREGNACNREGHDSQVQEEGSGMSDEGHEEDSGIDENRSVSGRRFAFPWLFTGLFSSSANASNGNAPHREDEH